MCTESVQASNQKRRHAKLHLQTSVYLVLQVLFGSVCCLHPRPSGSCPGHEQRSAVSTPPTSYNRLQEHPIAPKSILCQRRVLRLRHLSVAAQTTVTQYSILHIYTYMLFHVLHIYMLFLLVQ